ncbi:hypothetical protein GN958_ATG08768 [Phytophthora infestans]|uniref:Uncharacterized protein n=1 Tax=Phytophthora infestans TaxID=4787 RepID=A0A8S9UV33_PHYIN|nr:hypothetical protein GN958_ATG08768 [Phytophthora infestans]
MVSLVNYEIEDKPAATHRSEDDEPAELLPHATSERRLRDLLGELKDVELVAKALHVSNVEEVDVEDLNVEEVDVEEAKGRVQVLKGQAIRLTRAEKTALERITVDPRARDGAIGEEEPDTNASFVERAQKRRRPEERQPS